MPVGDIEELLKETPPDLVSLEPVILGPSGNARCDYCGFKEAAENWVRLQNAGGDTWDFELCGTCLAKEQREYRDQWKKA